jgi:hypothetical protein
MCVCTLKADASCLTVRIRQPQPTSSSNQLAVVLFASPFSLNEVILRSSQSGLVLLTWARSGTARSASLLEPSLGVAEGFHLETNQDEPILGTRLAHASRQEGPEHRMRSGGAGAWDETLSQSQELSQARLAAGCCGIAARKDHLPLLRCWISPLLVLFSP